MEAGFTQPRENVPSADFPESALHPIPGHHGSVVFWDYDSYPKSLLLRRQKEDVQARRLPFFPPAKQLPDVPGPGQSTRRGQAATARRPRSWARPPHRPYFEPTLTTRRRLPRERRRLRAFRPPLVCMRARKPCLFFRFRFRGLYVGIMRIHLLGPWLRCKNSFKRYPRARFRVNPESPFPPWLCPGPNRTQN